MTRSLTLMRSPSCSAIGIASASVSDVIGGTLTLPSGPAPALIRRNPKITAASNTRTVTATPAIVSSVVRSGIASSSSAGGFWSNGSEGISGSPGPASPATRATRVPASARGAPAAGPTARGGIDVRPTLTTYDSSASATSVALCVRFVGLTASSCIVIDSSSTGISGRSVRGDGTASSAPRSAGRRPVSSSKRTTPSPKRSDDDVAGAPAATSGAT